MNPELRERRRDDHVPTAVAMADTALTDALLLDLCPQIDFDGDPHRLPPSVAEGLV